MRPPPFALSRPLLAAFFAMLLALLATFLAVSPTPGATCPTFPTVAPRILSLAWPARCSVLPWILSLAWPARCFGLSRSWLASIVSLSPGLLNLLSQFLRLVCSAMSGREPFPFDGGGLVAHHR